MWRTTTTGARIYLWTWIRQSHERSSRPSSDRSESCPKSVVFIIIMSAWRREIQFSKSSLFNGYRFSGRPIRRSQSIGKTSPLHTYCIFFAEVCRMASHFPLAVSDTSVFSLVSVVIASQRRTTHPSGSRLVENSPFGQFSAPGASAPQKTIRTRPCPNVKITRALAPLRRHALGGSRPRRRQRNKRIVGPFQGAESRTIHR